MINTLCESCELREVCTTDDAIQAVVQERSWYRRGIMTYDELGTTGLAPEQVDALKVCIEAWRDYSCDYLRKD